MFKHWRIAAGLSLFGFLLSACKSESTADVAEQVSAIVTDPPVVISQVYGGGGNANATHRNDFVELFNRSTAPQSITGWSVQYTSSTGAAFFSQSVTQLTGTLPPGGYFLVQMSSGGGTGVLLPTPDATGTAAMAAGAGKVALVSSITGLACNGSTGQPCDAAMSAQIQDLVGYGTGTNAFEGAGPTATISATLAAFRAGGGCTDTNNNAGNFSTATPSPRNSGTTTAPCGGDGSPFVGATIPTGGATGVAAGTSVTITFSEPVNVSGSWFTFSCGTSGTVAPSVSGGPTSYVLQPPAPLAAGETCTVTVLAAAVTDVDSVDPPDLMATNHQFAFTVAAPVVTIPIRQVQGAGHLSPLNGQPVTVGPAVVTAVDTNGFYMQDPAPDADVATSEGIFVFTSSAPPVVVGHVVNVQGTVSEFRPGCTPSCTPSDDDYNNLTITELVSPVITILGSDVLPSPVVLGTGMGLRAPPTTVIDDDAGGNVETGGTFDPTTDGIDFMESLEGMRVRLDSPIAVSPTRSFSSGSMELAVLPQGGAGAGLLTPRGGIVLSPGDFNPERLILDDSLPVVPSLPLRNVGDTFSGSVTGVVTYGFSNYKVAVSEPLPTTIFPGPAPETSPLTATAPTHLTVASMNVENLDPTDPPTKFSRLATILLNNLGAPDMVALEEVQDNTGPTSDGVVAATTTLNMLVAAITTAGGPAYSYRQIDPQNNQDGGEPGGNIRVVFLYRTDRGLAFVDRPGGGTLTAVGVAGGGATTQLTQSPGRIDPTNTAFANSRKPLAGELTFGGRKLFVIANHFNSKGGDQPLYGRFQPPTLSSETQRLAQANVVASFVGSLLAADPAANIILLGDLNDFQFSAPLGVLKAAGLSTLIETLPANERYTYVYDGNSQALDHIMTSAPLTSRATFDVVHVNAEYADQASDHDPGLVRFDFGTAPVITSTPAQGALPGSIYTYDVNATGSPAPTYALVASPAGMTIDPVTGVLTWQTGSAGTFGVTVRAQNGVAPEATQAFSVVVSAPPSVPALPAPGLALLTAALATCGAWASPPEKLKQAVDAPLRNLNSDTQERRRRDRDAGGGG